MDLTNAPKLKRRDAVAIIFSWHHSRKRKEKEVSYNYKIYFTACYVFAVQSFHALYVGRKFARQQCSNVESSSHQLVLLAAFLDCISINHVF